MRVTIRAAEVDPRELAKLEALANELGSASALAVFLHGLIAALRAGTDLTLVSR